MKKAIRTLRSRITGFSTPIIGVSWEPPADEAEACRDLVTFLEDCRVLYAAEEAENPHHCVQSVMRIRHHLTDVISNAPAKSLLETGARQMRVACRGFLDEVQTDPDIEEYGFSQGHWPSWRFLPALGALRARIGTQLAVLAAAYGSNVADQFAAIMPPPLGDDE